jgi:hypothetical protein
MHTGLPAFEYTATAGYSCREDEDTRNAYVLMGKLLENVFLEKRWHGAQH